MITKLLRVWQFFIFRGYLPYSGVFEAFFEKNTESIEQKSIFSVQCLGISIFINNFAIDAEKITSRRSI